jgi:copper chaperone CopZ
VRRALEGLPGVKKAQVSFRDRTAVVQYEKGKVSIEEMVRALRKKWYDARPLPVPGG